MFSEIKNYISIYSNKKYSFITGNATSAIYLALKTSGIPKGSKIAVPNITCPDPVYALIWAGYKPEFIDVNLDDYNMNIISLKNKLKSDTNIKGIIAVHLFGNACDIVKIKKLADEYKCFLLEDCAQAFGNEIKKGKLGSFGDVSIFSFGKGKIIEIGHGGVVSSNNKQLIDKLKKEYEKLPNYNHNQIEKLAKLHRDLYYKLYYLGMRNSKLNILNLIYPYFFKNYYLYKFDKSKIDDILKKLQSFEKNKKERIEIVNYYLEKLQNFELPKLNNKENIFSRFTIKIDNAAQISKIIRNKGIPSNTMYPMLIDRFRLFFNKNEFMNSYALKGRLLNLWTNNLSIKQLKEVVKILKDF